MNHTEWSFIVMWQSRASPRVDAHFFAVREYDLLESNDLLAVSKLIAGACDHIAGLDRFRSPAICFHPVDGGPPNRPLLSLRVTGPNLERKHRVRVLPHDFRYGSLDCHELGHVYRPRVMGREWKYGGEYRNHDRRGEHGLVHGGSSLVRILERNLACR